jgi:tRNA threonylcarbamoyladenosine biosynthesis protein TsaB
MRILAIETVELTGSVAALEGQTLLRQLPLDTGRRSAQTLIPGIQQLLGEVCWRPGQVELVAVAAGPGSFTGLRIGVTTAKTLAYALQCEVLGVNTLEAIGQAVPAEIARFSAVVDAQRGELFVADFERLDAGGLRGAESTRIVTRQEFLATLAPDRAMTGPALRTLAASLPPDVPLLDASLWSASAAAVGRLAGQRYAAGYRTAALELMPVYYRRTAAEEQWDRRPS